jgi:hypothetical protein
MPNLAIALIFVRVLTPQLRVRHIVGDGLRRRNPALADLRGAELPLLGEEAELGSTESELGRSLGERNESLGCFQRPSGLFSLGRQTITPGVSVGSA